MDRSELDARHAGPRRQRGLRWLVAASLLAMLSHPALAGGSPPSLWLETSSEIFEPIGYRIVEPLAVYRRDLPEWRAIDPEAVGVVSVKSDFPVTVGRPLYYRFTFTEEVFTTAEAADRRRTARLREQREGSVAQAKEAGIVRMFAVGPTLYLLDTDVAMFEPELERLVKGLREPIELEADAALDDSQARRRLIERLRRSTNERLTIALVQRALAERAYDPGRADGLLGPRTRRALLAFQQRSGLPETGSIDTAVTRALDVPADPIAYYASQQKGKAGAR